MTAETLSIGIVQCADDGHLAEFLAQTGMRRTGHQPTAKEIEDQSLGFTDQVPESVEFPIREPHKRLSPCIAGNWQNVFHSCCGSLGE